MTAIGVHRWAFRCAMWAGAALYLVSAALAVAGGRVGMAGVWVTAAALSLLGVIVGGHIEARLGLLRANAAADLRIAETAAAEIERQTQAGRAVVSFGGGQPDRRH